jgi:hypothetical protein
MRVAGEEDRHELWSLGGRDVGLREIIPPIQEGQVKCLCTGIGKTVAHVQRNGVAYPAIPLEHQGSPDSSSKNALSADSPPGFDSDFSSSWIDFSRSISGIAEWTRSYSCSTASHMVAVRVLRLSFARRRTATSVA